MSWKTFKLLYRKFVRDNVYQSLSESTGFCGRYAKNILVCFFPVHSVVMWLLRAASISIHAPWLRHKLLFAPASLILMLFTICEMKTSSNYVPAYHMLSDQAKVYGDLLHHDLHSLTKL